MTKASNRLVWLWTALTGLPVREAVAVLGLYVLGVPKPLVDMLTASPDFFTLHNVTNLGVVATCAALLAPPGVLLVPWLLLIRRGYVNAARLILAAGGAIFAALAVAVIVRQSNLPLPAIVSVLMALTAGSLAAWSFWRAPRVVEFFAISGLLASLHVLWSMYWLVPPVFRAPVTAALSSGQADRKPVENVVILVFDELSTPMLMRADGELHRERFPGFARLLDQSTWYVDAKSVGCYTQLAVPAILTGTYPRPSRAAPSVYHYPHNLFTMLLRTHAAESWEPITQLCPSEVCNTRSRFRLPDFIDHLTLAYAHAVVPAAWSSHLTDLQSLWVRAFQIKKQDRAAAGDRRAQARDFLASLDRNTAAGPWLKFAHFALPHAPLEFLGTGQYYFFGERYLFGADAPALAAMLWGRDDDHVNQNYYRHLLQTQYADWIVAETIRRLERAGELDRTLIIVTSDHGVHYRSGEYHRETTPTNYVFQASVPLFIKAPGQKAGGIRREQALNIDIVPTILSRLGLRSPSLDGRDLGVPPKQPQASTFKHACIDVQKGSPVISYRDYPADTRAAVLEEAKRAEALFGAEATPRLRFSRYRDLIGRPTSELPQVPPLADATAIYFPRNYNWNEIDLNSEWLPIHMDGRFNPGQSRDAGPHFLAVAINDRIAAVMPTLRIGSEHVISMMIETRSLSPGRNNITFFRVVLQGETPALQPVQVGYR